MRARFWAAYGALALALTLLAPALTPLSGSMDAFSADLANGTFRPFGQLGGGQAPITYSGTLGGLTGDSPGNYLPGSSDLPRQWVMDRDGRAGRVVIDEVFDPGLGAMKRLKAYDRVAADGETLEVAQPQLRRPVADPTLQYSRFLEASFLVQFRPQEAIPIYSPHPRAVIEAFRTDPPLTGSVTFLQDGADTLYAMAQVDRVALLNVTFRVSPDYYAFDASPEARVSDYRYGVGGVQRPLVDAALVEDARLVLARAGVEDPTRVKDTIDALAAYFRSFTEGEIPPPSEVESLYLALALGEKGCCRHRAFAFMVTAQAVGIPTRVVVNEAHAFVEVQTPDGHWAQINLGGCGSYQMNNPNNVPSLFEQATDPRREANPDEGQAVPRVETFTNITDSPPRIVKGQPFQVVGTVLSSDGRGVPGMRIDVYLNETKESPGKLAGAGTTASDGTFRIEARVPLSSPARGYQLVARATDGHVGTTRYAESWSDPPIEVFAPTRFVASPVTAAVGFPANVTGRLMELGGSGVPDATISWSADGVPQGEVPTDASGRFVTRVTFDAEGPHTVTVRFEGTSNHGPATGVINLTAERGAILLPAEPPVLVRGEGGAIGGRLVIQGVSPAGRIVRGSATFPGNVDEAMTDRDGAFLLPLAPDARLPPGAHTVTLEVPAFALKAIQPVRVAVRPVLEVDAPAVVGPREPFVVTARVASDNGTALAGAIVDVTLDGNASTKRSLLTNRTGHARFEMRPDGLEGGPHRILVAFPGDAAHVQASLARGFDVDLPWYARVPPLAYAGALAFLVVALLAVPLARGGPVRRALEGALARAHRPERRFLSLEFPDHPPGVPPVFEPGEEARVRVRVRDREANLVDAPVGLLADGARVTAEGDAFVVRVERAGPLRLRAHAKGLARLWTRHVDVDLPVASYRKAVEDGFVTLRARARLPAAATPGDVVAKLERRLPPETRASLREAASLFDVADYSERPVDRAFYHAFARAAASVADEVPEVVDARA